MIPNIGATGLIIFLVVILLLFGAKRIPELARSLGGGLREFRRGAAGAEDLDEGAIGRTLEYGNREADPAGREG